MRLPKLNWLIVVVVLSATAGLLYVGHNEWQLRVIQNPLQEELAGIEGILSIELQQQKQATRLLISVNREAEFPQIARRVSRLIGLKPYEIVWDDNPNSRLLEVREQLDLALQEARWQHQFVLLQQRIEEIAEYHGVEYQLGADEGYIYLSLLDGAYTLREAVPLLQVGGGAK